MNNNINTQTFVCRPNDNLQQCLENSIVASEDPILTSNIISITLRNSDRTGRETWVIFYTKA